MEISRFFDSVPQDYKLNPGAVEAIFEQPGNANNILIGYNRGLIVLWDRTENTAVKTFTSAQQLESLCWHDDGETFTSSHNDGNYYINARELLSDVRRQLNNSHAFGLVLGRVIRFVMRYV